MFTKKILAGTAVAAAAFLSPVAVAVANAATPPNNPVCTSSAGSSGCDGNDHGGGSTGVTSYGGGPSGTYGASNW
ncbi:hypothetical protein GCM10023147_31250 [Tsukamurella soli]|uniref:Uncharacterized protein n=2 Tax=Tsukamurella soli TaxID=644556 RepID=A0ABP8JV50_9ACTN